jgi:hypothetical protein
MPDTIKDDILVGGENAIWPDVATLLEGSFFEIVIFNRDGIPVTDLLAGYLTEDIIVPLKVCDYQCRTPLCLSQIRKRERDNNDIASYKFCQA